MSNEEGDTEPRFTGKERDPETGLDYFGARYDMSALARWGGLDPLGEKHPEWSPYNYVLDNPPALVDPDGKQIDVNVKETNLYWENVAVVGHQRGGVGGVLQAAGATAMLTGIEFLGLNQADQGFDRMADGHALAGAAMVTLAVAGDLPGGQFIRGGALPVRIGQAGEAVVARMTGLTKNTLVKLGNRIPDFVDAARGLFHESKNVKRLVATPQLREMVEHLKEGEKLVIHVPRDIGRRVSRWFDELINVQVVRDLPARGAK